MPRRAPPGGGVAGGRPSGAARLPRPRARRLQTVRPAPPAVGFAGLSHLDRAGRAHMVDVAPKPETPREARARATLRMRPATLAAIRAGTVAKGDVLGVARIAGIMAAKRTAELIPLCHPLRLTGIDVGFVVDRPRAAVHIETVARTVDKTGVEMEALTAAAAAGLALYDMVKAIDRGLVLTGLCLVEKSGGRSGRWIRPGAGRPPGRSR
jgi:cyclic pyranopterin monophosphate synthase